MQVKDCLVEHRTDAGFSAACKEEVDQMVERRVRDFQLDTRLARYCKVGEGRKGGRLHP